MKQQQPTRVNPSIDISITGSMGFYTITPNTPQGEQWISEHLPNALSLYSTVFCDDTRMTQDIADGAATDGLAVTVNDQRYLA